MRILHRCNAASVLEEWRLWVHIPFSNIIDERITPMSTVTITGRAGQIPRLRFLNSLGRALVARDTFNELSLLNDLELSKRGLDRNGISKHVVDKLG
jgi:hypothetical protein